jgi:hypothetical protein
MHHNDPACPGFIPATTLPGSSDDAREGTVPVAKAAEARKNSYRWFTTKRQLPRFRGTKAMVALMSLAHQASTDAPTDFDAIIIGAGVSGLYQLYELRELDLKVRVLETGTNVGGTWYWNR